MKKNDMLVSKSIVEKGAWEENNVKNLMKGISLYKDAIFIGKIHMFSLFLAPILMFRRMM